MKGILRGLIGLSVLLLSLTALAGGGPDGGSGGAPEPGLWLLALAGAGVALGLRGRKKGE